MNSFPKDQSLLESLTSYSHSDFYPFHMPGHKRAPLDFPNPWFIDITEIDGFDNLHHAEGILNDLQEQAARLFGARQSFCLVNGSTCGILAAVSACVKPGGKLLMSRNCHKSAYHAVYLRNITPIYVMPQMTDFGIMGSLSPDTVAHALEEHPGIQAVLVVSPTYDGVVSDMESIAKIVHEHGIPLIVDEAHGAHLPLVKTFPESALACGADIVIHSLHKTLPAFTQTALLHINSDLVDEAVIRRFLGIYQSSSPSYLLMASMDQCFRILKEHGPQLFADFRKNLDSFYQSCETLQYIRVFRGLTTGRLPSSRARTSCCSQQGQASCLADPAVYAWDDSKILISGEALGLSGQALYDILLERYHLQFEMASGHYALALTSLMDRPEGFLRLFDALAELDRCSVDSFHFQAKSACISAQHQMADCQNPIHQQNMAPRSNALYQLPQQVMSISEAMDCPGTTTRLEDAAGTVSQEYLYLYPPGIPLVTPGERIEEQLLTHILSLKESGLPLEGLSDVTNSEIRVVHGISLPCR